LGYIPAWTIVAEKEKSYAQAVPRPTLDEWLATFSRLDRAGAEFLKVDVETAPTFAHIALQALDDERRDRNRHSARRAYVRLKGRINLSEAEAKHLDSHLQRLESELIQFGETF